MHASRASVLAALAAVLALIAPGVAGAAPRPDLGEPLAQTHAHNDYEHERPLFDALEHGFTSVEADVWAVGDELLVAHDFWELDPDRTLRSLYLDRLRDAVRGGSGSTRAGTASSSCSSTSRAAAPGRGRCSRSSSPTTRT